VFNLIAAEGVDIHEEALKTVVNLIESEGDRIAAGKSSP
jgi:hypothetical protein